MIDNIKNKLLCITNIYFNNTYKILCVKNKYFYDKYECIKCNNFEDFEDEKKYWINRDCEIKIFEINKCITEYRNILPYETAHLYDWTQNDIYKGHPRRPTLDNEKL
jgi:hypothetical protein